MTIAVSQRVVVDPRTGERRDALDQRWPRFLRQVGYLAIAVPNSVSLLPSLLCEIRPRGVLLTGGNDLVTLGGTAPERDDTEAELMAYAHENALPLLGVCRGMQIIQKKCGVRLHRVEGHVTATQVIQFDGREAMVNSYHNYGSQESVLGLEVCGRSDDGVVKAVRADSGRILGIMWHPERIDPSREDDILLFRSFFGGGK